MEPMVDMVNDIYEPVLDDSSARYDIARQLWLETFKTYAVNFTAGHSAREACIAVDCFLKKFKHPEDVTNG